MSTIKMLRVMFPIKTVLTPKPRPDAHFWVSKVNELLLLHSIWNWGGRVGVGFRIQSHPVLFELLISGNMRGTVRYTPGAQDTANMVSGRVLIRAVHTSLALPLVNKPPLLCFFTLYLVRVGLIVLNFATNQVSKTVPTKLNELKPFEMENSFLLRSWWYQSQAICPDLCLMSASWLMTDAGGSKARGGRGAFHCSHQRAALSHLSSHSEQLISKPQSLILNSDIQEINNRWDRGDLTSLSSSLACLCIRVVLVSK